MKLSISNIAWSSEHDDLMYSFLSRSGFDGLEIAPTRLFPDSPYDHLREASQFALRLSEYFGLKVSSMQSIWYGRSENLFESRASFDSLFDYTRRAIDFAAALECNNLVFGCPKNRRLPDGADPDTALEFFSRLGEYAGQCGTVLSMEANPVIYGTNYITHTAEAFELVRRVNSRGFMVNLDLGTVIENGEDISSFESGLPLINHVHISEPGLVQPSHYDLYRDVCSFLEPHYDKYISIEMGRSDPDAVQLTARRVAEILGK